MMNVETIDESTRAEGVKIQNRPNPFPNTVHYDNGQLKLRNEITNGILREQSLYSRSGTLLRHAEFFHNGMYKKADLTGWFMTRHKYSQLYDLIERHYDITMKNTRPNREVIYDGNNVRVIITQELLGSNVKETQYYVDGYLIKVRINAGFKNEIIHSLSIATKPIKFVIKLPFVILGDMLTCNCCWGDAKCGEDDINLPDVYCYDFVGPEKRKSAHRAFNENSFISMVI